MADIKLNPSCLTFRKILYCAKSTAKPTMSHVHLAKTQISLHNRIAPDKKGYPHIIFFLFLDKNVCCGYSFDAASTEYPLHVFMENFFKLKKCLMWRYATVQSVFHHIGM